MVLNSRIQTSAWQVTTRMRLAQARYFVEVGAIYIYICGIVGEVPKLQCGEVCPTALRLNAIEGNNR